MALTLSIYPPRSRKRILLERAFYTAVAVGGSLILTAFISYALNGKVRGDFMLTAFLCSFFVSIPMIANFQRMRRDLADALARERALQIREEKQMTLRQTMDKVQHHVNNLANNLQMVEVEYKKHRSLSPETLSALQVEIRRTSSEMHMLGQLDDPFKADAFELDRDRK
jgi:hypothetical protein